MTEQDWIELGKRAVACEGWRWMRGMLDLGDWEVRGEYNGGHGVRVVDRAGKTAIVPPTRMSAPDLRDPATVGCLLALVREVWGHPRAFALPSGDFWQVLSGWYGDDLTGDRATEAEALVAALEAAPTAP